MLLLPILRRIGELRIVKESNYVKIREKFLQKSHPIVSLLTRKWLPGPSNQLFFFLQSLKHLPTNLSDFSIGRHGLGFSEIVFQKFHVLSARLKFKEQGLTTVCDTLYLFLNWITLSEGESKPPPFNFRGRGEEIGG